MQSNKGVTISPDQGGEQFHGNQNFMPPRFIYVATHNKHKGSQLGKKYTELPADSVKRVYIIT